MQPKRPNGGLDELHQGDILPLNLPENFLENALESCRGCSSSGSNIHPQMCLFRFESGASRTGSQSTGLTVATVWKGAGERRTTNVDSARQFLTTMHRLGLLIDC